MHSTAICSHNARSTGATLHPGATPINIRGYLNATLQYKGRTTEERVYVSRHGATILGWPTQAKLQIVLDPTQLQPVLQTTQSVVDEFEDVYKQNSTTVAKHFKHRIQWRDGETPVQHKVHKIPLSVQPALSDEIKRLQNNGVIEQIEASKWVSPIVVARKPNGTIRMCVDLRDVNSKIIVETHPLPSINEMLMTLKKAEIYTTIEFCVQPNPANRGIEGHYVFHHTRRSVPVYTRAIRTSVSIIVVPENDARHLQRRQRRTLLSRRHSDLRNQPDRA